MLLNKLPPGVCGRGEGATGLLNKGGGELANNKLWNFHRYRLVRYESCLFLQILSTKNCSFLHRRLHVNFHPPFARENPYTVTLRCPYKHMLAGYVLS